MNKQIEALLSKMTLEEKISMLAGADNWTTVAIDKLGIPAIKVTDGPNGARGSGSSIGAPSACFPVGTALAATWNTELVGQIGRALAEEVKYKGAHILLAPTVNIHRSPLAGRNFECYSEDPYLSGQMAVAYIKGLQSQGVGACIKHFVCNDSEFERHTISSEVSERALREIYLAPFQLAIREAKPWAVMSAYNKVNGTWASENPYLLRDILKEEWGFDGIVISDWYGTNSIDIGIGGLDLEMPGPARWMGERMLQAVKADQISEELIDDKVRRVLRTISRAGAFENPDISPERAIDNPEHRRLIRKAGGEAIVLLKNAAHVLPLDRDKLRSLAIIGPNAKQAQIMGGGSAYVNAHYRISPYDGIVDRLGDEVELGYHIGCTNHKRLPLIDVDQLTAADGSTPGLSVQFYDNLNLSGEPVHSQTTTSTELSWFGGLPASVDISGFSVQVRGSYTPLEAGTYVFGLLSSGLSRLFIDEQKVIDNWERSLGQSALLEMSREEASVTLELEAGRAYRLRMEFASVTNTVWQAVRLGCLRLLPADSIQKAADLAAQCDAAVVFAGLTDEWDSEGFDRPDIELPGRQNELIQAVARSNQNTVVVLNTGAAISMDWLDEVAAVIQAWYPGQEAGNAIADVLFGDVNPSGKLPQTFPRRLQDNPTYLNYPGENGQVFYGEGIFVGYRYYEKKEIKPLFPFGFGLSYTSFTYHNLVLNDTEFGPDDGILVSVDVENSGSRAGQEVVQLYVRDVESSLARPVKELKRFAKVALEAGERQTVQFKLGGEALACYDTLRHKWVTEAGAFEVMVGSSSADIHLSERFNWRGEPQSSFARQGRYHTGLALESLMANTESKAVLEKHLSGLIDHPQAAMAMNLSLEQIAGFVPQLITPELLQAVNQDLALIGQDTGSE